MYTIYITYPLEIVDENEVLKNWIDSFIESLQIALPRVLNIKPTYLIKGKDFSDEAFESSLNTSGVYITMFDESFQKSELYQNELNFITKRLDLEGEDAAVVASKAKIFKVVRSPIEDDFLPKELVSVLTYNFYEKNSFNRKIKSFAFHGEYDTHSWNKVLDLAYDIHACFKDSLAQSSDKKEKKRTIFLANATSDQIHNRDDIKRELQHFGFQVLPLSTLPEDAEQLGEEINKNLEQCQLSIQLMGSQYGAMVKGAKYSFPDFQNRKIGEYQKEHPDKNLYRLIWIPAGMRSNDQRQKLYLKRLMRDEAGDNTEIIESPLESFKTLLTERLQQRDLFERLAKGSTNTVYIIGEENEVEKVDELCTLLGKSNLPTFKLDFSQQKDIYSRHLKNIIQSDSVLIYAPNSSTYWIRSKIRDLIKAPGLGKKEPYKHIGIISGTKFQVKDAAFLKTPIEYLDEEKTSIDGFIKKLVSNDHE